MVTDAKAETAVLCMVEGDLQPWCYLEIQGASCRASASAVILLFMRAAV